MTQMDNTVMIKLSGRIDSTNSADIENDILKQLEGKTDTAVTLDVEELEYISSAGLRVILRVKKTWPDVRIINASPEVYEILETTGFTEMMTVEKAYKVISVEGCEVIGEGFNGKVYRVDKDNVVKVYKNADALADDRALKTELSRESKNYMIIFCCRSLSKLCQMLSEGVHQTQEQKG